MFENDSFLDLTYTFHESRLSCWKPFYFAHITFSYLIMISGFLAMVSRLVPRLYFLHNWFGKMYIMFMLWGTATSLLIHNAGLPIGVLYSFLWVLSGLCVGWVAISIHQINMARLDLADGPAEKKELGRWGKIAARLFSLKTFHGCVMFVSWINIAGRVFVTPLADDFACYTYPAWKPMQSKYHNLTSATNITLLPHDDPKYPKMPWAHFEEGWATIMLFGPYFGAFLFGFIYLTATIKDRRVVPRRSGATPPPNLPEAAAVAPAVV